MTSQSGLTRFRLSDADEIVPDSAYANESEIRHGGDYVRETSLNLSDDDTDAIKQMFTEKEFETSDLLKLCGPFLVSDTTNNILYVSPGLREMIPDTYHTATSLAVSSLFHPDDRNSIAENLSAQVQDDSVQLRIRVRDGSYKWSNITILPGKGGVYKVLQISNIDKLYRSNMEHQNNVSALEQKAADLTRQLEALNKEMEAFSYSVSHDMRAPVRIINGYAHILETDFGAEMSEECRRIFDIILANTGHMNQMIEAVLGLSRISQKDLLITDIDMPTLVRSIIDEQLSVADNKENITIEIRNLLSTSCDNVLIKCVWKQLISNALKFTTQEVTPHITIGSERKRDKVVYYIKDNGVGFDMQYAEKLFGIFQRLHKRTEYPGQGAGLATVKRIIMKHGGNIWAEAGAGKGATFYFSLPFTDQ